MNTYSTVSRRQFILSSAALSAMPFQRFTRVFEEPLTIQQIIDAILKEVPGAPYAQTVDTLKSGNANQAVTGIVTTMFTTINVIKKAIDLKANFIIAHEPTFYNHLDEVKWLEEHESYKFKRNLLESNNIAVWRLHDYIHSFRPDGVLIGVLQAMGWEQYYDSTRRNILKVPSMTVGEIVERAKHKLGIQKLRVVGDLSQKVETIGLMPGAAGGRAQIGFMKSENPDLLMVGEVQEWETSEYFRDLNASGQKKTLVILGHAVSEEPGMSWMASWLTKKFPAQNVTHVASGDPFLWV